MKRVLFTANNCLDVGVVFGVGTLFGEPKGLAGERPMVWVPQKETSLS